MNLMVKMPENVENKGFYRTQSKIATELIIEPQKLFFSSFVNFTYIFF